MKRFILAFAAMIGLFAIQPTAEAKVRIAIDLSTQRMSVESSKGSYNWAISSARSGFATPRGSYAPTSLQRMHYSHKYHMSPMPYSIFFRGGYAIHGTYAVSSLGRPASHGCIRLAPANAASLFQMVSAEGASISITGAPPSTGRVYASAKKKTHLAAHKRSHSRAYYAGRLRTAPMAYAPAPRHRALSPGGWQRDPAGGWTYWGR